MCIAALIEKYFVWRHTTEQSCISFMGERTGVVVRALDSESGDPGSILSRVGVLFP